MDELVEATSAFFEDVKTLQRQHELGSEPAEDDEDAADPDDSVARLRRPRAQEMRE